MRTLLGLYVKPPSEELSSVEGSRSALTVEEAQETLDGLTVYHGKAAHLGSKTIDGPHITEDDDDQLQITETERVVEDPKLVEYIAVPDANPGFAAFSTSDNTFARNLISRQTGGWIEPAAYDVNAITDYLREEYQPTIEQIGWEDGDETGVFYPDDEPDAAGDTVVDVDRAVRKQKSQIGFRYFDDGGTYRGTLAGTGYCNLYSPELGAAGMAEFIRSELLQFSGVPDVASAEEIADATGGVGVVCEDCERMSDKLRELDNGDVVCPVCEDKREEADEDGDDEVAGAQERFSELDTVNVDGGGGE